MNLMYPRQIQEYRDSPTITTRFSQDSRKIAPKISADTQHVRTPFYPVATDPLHN